MQLKMSLEELKLLADKLDERDTELRRQIDRAEPGPAKLALQRKQQIGDVLLDKVISMHFELAADELDNLSDVLLELHSTLRARIAQAPAESELKDELQRHSKLLQSMRDKVTEACAMA